MATLAIAGIGAAVGWGIGGTATALSIGWTVGSFVGQYLFPTQLPDVEGPRVTDLSASTSAYGLVKTRVFGTTGVAGNLIWTEPLTEIRSEEEVGGKGGGGTEQTVVNYTYTVTCAFALCEGPVDSIRRIWFDAELVYDARDTNTGIVIKEGLNLRLYNGTETQGRDPSISAFEGVNNTPAYRGTCYFVVQDLLLTEYGNRRPNVRAEVLRQGTSSNTATNIGAESYSYIFYDQQTGWLGTADSVGSKAAIWDAASGVIIAEWPIPSGALGSWNIKGMRNGICYGDEWYDGNNQFIGSVDAITGQVLWQSEARNINDPLTGRIETHKDWCLRFGLLGVGVEVLEYNADGSLTTVGIIPELAGGGRTEQGCVENDTKYVWITQTNGVRQAAIGFMSISLNPDYPYYSAQKWIVGTQGHLIDDYFDSSGNPTSPLHTGVQADNFANLTYYLQYEPTTQSILLHQFTDDSGNALPVGLYRIQCTTRHDLDTMTIAARNTDTGGGGSWNTTLANDFVNIGNPLVGDGRVYYLQGGTGHELHEFNAEDLTLTATYAWTLPNLMTANNAANWAGRTVYAGVINSGQYKLQWNRWGEEGMSLDAVVKEICLAHNLTETEIDVTDLASKTVRGFSIGRPTKARTQIEALMGGYFFDAVESDKKLKFTLRDNASLVTIPEGDLAAHESGQQLPDAVILKRKELYQIPETVQVTHMSAALEYEPSSQYARQPTSPTSDVFKLELPIVFNDDEAAQIANKWLQALRAERHSGTITLGPEYLEYDPADIITVQNDGLQYQFRVLKTALGGLPGITKAEVSTYDQRAYDSSAKGSSPVGYYSSTLNQQPISAFFMVNSPPLRDTDDDGGFYYVVSPYADANNWPGSVAKRRDPTDEGSNFISIGTQFNRATIGYENNATALPAGPNATTWDWTNSITVRLWNNDVDSLTTETRIDVLNGRNLLYWPQTGELMQFQVATDNGDDTYTLTGLLRGRRGTDVFMDEHVAGEPFCIITPETLYKFTDVVSNVGRTFEYGSMTLNTTDDRAPKQTWTQSGGLITPLSPVALEATRQANGDLDLTWVRRARLNAEWLDDVDVPLDEPTEEYDVELYNDATLLRTVRVIGSNSYTYTIADQTTDYGGEVGQFNMTVYQISSRVGRGQPGYLLPILETRATDFSEYALFEEPPLNWTRIANALATWEINTGGDDQVVQCTRGSAGHAFLFWESTTIHDDVEVLIKTSTTLNPTTGGVGTQSIHGVIVRAQEVAQTGYLAGFWGDTGTASLVYKNDGSKGYTVLHNAGGKQYVNGQQWWVRLRAQGETISVKWWNASGSEPADWDFVVEDTNETGAGRAMLAGAYEYWGGPENFDFFSIAYDGRTAPSTA